jgi:hypothetical protein
MDFGGVSVDLGLVIAAGSAVVSIGAVVMSVRTAREQQDLQRQVAQEEQELLFEQVRIQRDSDVLRWTNECIAILANCESFVAVFDPQQRDRQVDELYRTTRYRLSALIDQGRLFFPNERPEAKGTDKPLAYQGYRQQILDVLVWAYDAFARYETLTSDPDRAQLATSLGEFRRRFVSEAQIAIDPRRFIALKEMNERRSTKGLEIQTPGKYEETRPGARILKRPLSLGKPG